MQANRKIMNIKGQDIVFVPYFCNYDENTNINPDFKGRAVYIFTLDYI